MRDWQTRAGTVELRTPKLRKDCCFSSVLKPRRTAETVPTALIQQASVQGVSARSVDDLLRAIAMDCISKSQLSRLCGELDEPAAAFLARPVEGGWPCVWLGATCVEGAPGRCAGTGTSSGW